MIDQAGSFSAPLMAEHQAGLVSAEERNLVCLTLHSPSPQLPPSLMLALARAWIPLRSCSFKRTSAPRVTV